MRDAHLVLWRVSPADIPEIWRHCPGCSFDRPFVCSGKFRCNLQKKRLDVWLIYRCRDCGRRWNLPVLERRHVKSVDKALLEAFAADCPRQVQNYACDRELLRRHAKRLEVGREMRLEKIQLRADQSPRWTTVVTLSVPPTNAPRLDRLFARALCLSRKRLQFLIDAGILSLRPERPRSWRRPAGDGQRVALDLARLQNAPDLRDWLLQKLL